MGQQREVNETQRSVLTWIANGCPEGVMTGSTYKTTAVALQTRGLITVSKKRGVWSATLTDAGRYFLRHGDYPPTPSAPGATHSTGPVTSAAKRARPSASPSTRTQSRRPVSPTADEAAAFLNQLIADGGTRSVPGGDTQTLALVKAVQRHGLVPDSQLLTVDGTPHYATRRITLANKPHWMTTVLDPIPVADSLRKPHPAVAQLRTDKNRLVFRASTRSRALRLLDSVAKAARELGYRVTVPPADLRGHNSDLTIKVNEHQFGMRITEQTDKTPHTATQRELDEAVRPWGRTPPTYDHHPSGRLTITIEGGPKVRQEAFADTKTIDLADRLANVLQEIQLRAEAAEKRRIEAERRQAARRQAWETARAQAVTAYTDHHRAQTLAHQLADWQRSRDLHAYLDAMRTQIDTLPTEEQQTAFAWHAWATGHAKRLNPLTRPLSLPRVPEPHGVDLQPFMPPGFSVYGP